MGELERINKNGLKSADTQHELARRSPSAIERPRVVRIGEALDDSSGRAHERLFEGPGQVIDAEWAPLPEKQQTRLLPGGALRSDTEPSPDVAEVTGPQAQEIPQPPTQADDSIWEGVAPKRSRFSTFLKWAVPLAGGAAFVGAGIYVFKNQLPPPPTPQVDPYRPTSRTTLLDNAVAGTMPSQPEKQSVALAPHQISTAIQQIRAIEELAARPKGAPPQEDIRRLLDGTSSYSVIAKVQGPLADLHKAFEKAKADLDTFRGDIGGIRMAERPDADLYRKTYDEIAAFNPLRDPKYSAFFKVLEDPDSFKHGIAAGNPSLQLIQQIGEAHAQGRELTLQYKHYTREAQMLTENLRRLR